MIEGVAGIRLHYGHEPSKEVRKRTHWKTKMKSRLKDQNPKNG